jgi:hypothetical protein
MLAWGDYELHPILTVLTSSANLAPEIDAQAALSLLDRVNGSDMQTICPVTPSASKGIFPLLADYFAIYR